MTHALDVFTNPTEHPDVPVPQHVIERVVRNTDKITAIYLIRAAYRDPDGGWTTLIEAKEIRESILARGQYSRN